MKRKINKTYKNKTYKNKITKKYVKNQKLKNQKINKYINIFYNGGVNNEETPPTSQETITTTSSQDYAEEKKDNYSNDDYSNEDHIIDNITIDNKEFILSKITQILDTDLIPNSNIINKIIKYFIKNRIDTGNSELDEAERIKNEEIIYILNKYFEINNSEKEEVFSNNEKLKSIILDNNGNPNKQKLKYTLRNNNIDNLLIFIYFDKEYKLLNELFSKSNNYFNELFRKFIKHQLNLDIKRTDIYINEIIQGREINDYIIYKNIIDKLIEFKRISNIDDINKHILFLLQDIFNQFHMNIFNNLIKTLFKNTRLNILLKNPEKFIKLIINENEDKILISSISEIIITDNNKKPIKYINKQGKLSEYITSSLDEPRTIGIYKYDLEIDFIENNYKLDFDIEYNFEEYLDEFFVDKYEEDIINQNKEKDKSINPYIKYGIPLGFISSGLIATPFALGLLGGNKKTKYRKLRKRGKVSYKIKTKKLNRK
jgi:hypothetical protein